VRSETLSIILLGGSGGCSRQNAAVREVMCNGIRPEEFGGVVQYRLFDKEKFSLSPRAHGSGVDHCLFEGHGCYPRGAAVARAR
jgi:hypothetical protein